MRGNYHSHREGDFMDEELRLKMLSRARRENVIKLGTYDYNQKQMPIFQRDASSEFALFYDVVEDEVLSDVEDAAPAEAASDEELAMQIMTSNFRTGLSQSEVDSLLMGMV